ncbi:MAG: HAD-IA family hydrolase [Thermoplasmata archaeon]|nr:HAD-IA family hydrolase [Thermoplasmata archaeon]
MLVIFDLDGTIIDTREEIEYTFRKAFENLGLEFDERRMEESIGFAIEELIEALLGHYDARVEEEIRKIYYGMKDRKIRIFPGMERVIRENGFKKAIFTSKRRKPALRDLNYFNIVHLFDAIIGADDVKRKKPHGEGVLKIMSLLNERKEDTYVVGDTEMDILAAMNAGVRSIAVTWGFRSKEFLEALNPDYIVHRPEEILKIVKGE